MASEAIEAEEPREKHKWNESSKVYTRKIYKAKKINNPINTDTVNKDIPSGNTVDTSENRGINTTEVTTTNGTTPPSATNSPTATSPTTTTTTATATAAASDDKPKENGKAVVAPEEAAPQLSEHSHPTEDANCSQLQLQNSSRLEAASDIPVAGSEHTQPTVDASSSIPQQQNSPRLEGSSDIPVASEKAPPPEDANTSELQQQNSSRLEAASDVLVASEEAPPPEDVNSSKVQQQSSSQLEAVPDTLVISEDVFPQRSEHTQPTEDVNSSQQQHQNSSRLETASDDSWSHHKREDVPVPNGHDRNSGNGSVKPVVTRVDDRVNISLTAVRSKQEVRGLKRKLTDELEQVRDWTKQLEEKESQLSGSYNTGLGVSGDDGAGLGGLMQYVGASSLGGYNGSQFLANGGIDKGGGLRSTDVGSFGVKDSRPFRQLSVAVVDNNHGAHEVIEKEKRTPKANQYYRNSEFLLGKDRLPAESNKKHKSNGRKHGGGTEYGFGADKHITRSCNSLLQKLMNHKHGWVFNTPVDVQGMGLHDYFEIIKHPMDLGTVKDRLMKNWYKSPREFAEDVRLTFRNAMTYNPKGQDVHLMAEQLLNTFEKKWVQIEVEYEQKLRYDKVYDMGPAIPTSRKGPVRFPLTVSTPHLAVSAPHSLTPLTPPPPMIPADMRYLERSNSMNVPVESRPKPVLNAPMGRTLALKKPKAKDPHKRDMTFEEKQRLSTNLQSLPSEKLDNIVQIIKKKNSALCQHDDEIEVDIDSVDAETLWELDRFVTNYKKSLSKNKRKAELAKARAQAFQSAQQTNPAPSNNVEPPKESGTEERNIGHSSPAQGERRSDSASGSSSSSSSSSDSGSSSSDSDSDSSSGSEGGHSI